LLYAGYVNYALHKAAYANGLNNREATSSGYKIRPISPIVSKWIPAPIEGPAQVPEKSKFEAFHIF